MALYFPQFGIKIPIPDHVKSDVKSHISQSDTYDKATALQVIKLMSWYGFELSPKEQLAISASSLKKVKILVDN